MRLEDGYEKIRIARSGVNQEKVNRFLKWVEAQGYIVRDLYSDNRYEIDGISKKTQKEIQHWLESLGRTFKKTPQAILCKGEGCYNESDYASIYCVTCNQRIDAENRARRHARQQAAANRNPCWHSHCKNEAQRYSHFCHIHRDDRTWNLK